MCRWDFQRAVGIIIISEKIWWTNVRKCEPSWTLIIMRWWNFNYFCPKCTIIISVSTRYATHFLIYILLCNFHHVWVHAVSLSIQWTKSPSLKNILKSFCWGIFALILKFLWKASKCLENCSISYRCSWVLVIKSILHVMQHNLCIIWST